MYLVNIDQDVREDKQLLLLEHLVSLADKASVSRYYNGYLSSNEFENIQNKYEGRLLKRAESRRVNYKENSNGFKDRIDSMYKTTERVMSYFDVLEMQEMELLESVTLDDYRVHIDNPNIDGAISSNYTRASYVTEGPIQQIVYLEIEAAREYVISKIKGIFEFPYIISGQEFEDLVLYIGDRVLLAICSHEQLGHLFLHEEEAKKLVELNFIKRNALLEV